MLRLALRLLRLSEPRLLWKLVWNLGLRSVVSLDRFRRREGGGRYFPPFLFISPTNACNLHCRGCWVHQTRPPVHMSPVVLDRLIRSAKRHGNRFFGILGGEPLMYPHLFAVLARHPDCYFQVFTNGTLITDEVARTMRRLGNITPLISVEGLASESDRRRGGNRVFDRSLRGIRTLVRHRVITGIASSICRGNLDELATDAFVRQALDLGAAYLWFYIFRPVGCDPAPELALDADDVKRLRAFMVEARTRHPLMLVDAYWDDTGAGLCPAAVGISHHIAPDGSIEPCPPIQLACETIGAGDASAALARSRFLAAFRQQVRRRTRGCILLEDPRFLRELALAHSARDSSGRGTGLDDLARMTCHCSHDMPGARLPERNLFYRLAKRHWFFGFGAYG